MTSRLRPVLLSSCAVALVSCGVGSAGSAGGVPKPVGQPGGTAQAQAVSGQDCARIVREGAPASATEVTGGCLDHGKPVTLHTGRCRSGHIYLVFGQFKGLIGSVWHDVGPGHEAVAARFTKC